MSYMAPPADTRFCTKLVLAYPSTYGLPRRRKPVDRAW